MAAKSTDIPYTKAKPAPVVVIHGSEAVLTRKALDRIGRAATKPAGVETVQLDAHVYVRGELDLAASPSLFSPRKYIVVSSVEACSEDFLNDALKYVADPAEESVVVLKHAGGNRGSKLLTAIAKAGYPKVDASPLKSDADKQKYAQSEFKAAKRDIEPAALAALLNALGANLADLDAGVEQLVADTEGTITVEMVDRYYGGRVEATGFKVADAAVAGDSATALATLRHALATGTDPVPLVAVMAMKLRGLAKVQGLGGGSAQIAREVKMAPWQVDRARRDARNFSEEKLALALLATAAADEAVKGGGRDPVYAVEKLVTFVSRQASGF